MAGRLDDYRKDCAEMLQRFGQTDKPDDAHWVAWACALAPDATKDWPKAVALGREGGQERSQVDHLLEHLRRGPLPRRAIGRSALAAAHGGRCPGHATERGDQVVARLHLVLPGHGPSPPWAYRGGQEVARQGDPSTDKALKDHEAGTGEQMPWNRRVTLKLLRDEAEALLRPADKPPAGKEKAEKGK